MATIRAYTTIEQSRKLAEFLPLESADMCYRYYSGSMITGYGDCVLAKSFITGKNVIRENDLPCWSLAALLSVLPNYELNNFGNAIQLSVKRDAFETEGDETLLDLVVNTIIYLHELKKL